MTNKEYIIDALAGEFGEDSYDDVVRRFISCPCQVQNCTETARLCFDCVKEWLDKEVSE